MNSTAFDRTQKFLYTIVGILVAIMLLGMLFLLIEIGVSILTMSPLIGMAFFAAVLTAIIAPIMWAYRN